MTNEEKAREIAGGNWVVFNKEYSAALEMAEWKDKQYQPLVDVCKDLISTLQTSRAYHLGITALNTPQEIERKEIEGNTALIRGIDREIKYANEIINELLGEE